jgi:hypothetical protein|tara:strand:+ start:837 stop:1286 length:450 start_codon:yes stop_codon:yes gene_type:complete
MKKELTKILSDKNFTKDNVVTDREGMKNELYSSLGAVVTTLCWSVQNRVKSQSEYISKQVRELQEMTESAFTGSDVQEDRIQRKLDFIENLQTSNDEMESLRTVLYGIHKDEFGTEYTVPVRKSATADINSSSAMLQAKALLENMNLSK